jgi:hypothetical protein
VYRNSNSAADSITAALRREVTGWDAAKHPFPNATVAVKLHSWHQLADQTGAFSTASAHQPEARAPAAREKLGYDAPEPRRL